MKLKKDSTQEKVKREKSRKEVIILEMIGILLLVLSLACILIPVFLSRGDGNFRYGLPFIIAFFVLCISSVVVLIYVFPDAVVHDLHKSVDKYSNQSLSVLYRAEKERTTELFKKHGFKEAGGGFYRKKMISISKDSICYFVTFSDADDVDKAVDAAIGKLERMKEKTRCVCLILFIYKNNPTKNDKEQLRMRCAYMLTDETVLPDSEGVNAVPVLVDSATGEGTFLSKMRGISIYAHGCRLLKRYIQ